jgi:hypothetical protein
LVERKDVSVNEGNSAGSIALEVERDIEDKVV